MLKQDAAVPEPPISVPPITVAQARVTPEELSAALAAIDARRLADAKTIPIDQAVSELHLDSTSDEIWAVVQAQRAKVAAEREKQPPAQAAQPVTKSKTTSRHGWLTMFTPVLIGWVLLQAGVIPHFWNHSSHVAAPILRPLSAVPDGTEVYADDAALIQISEGTPAAKVSVSQNLTGNRWNLIKTGGHVYLRGYIESTSSFKTLQGKPLNVYNDDNSGELDGAGTSQITLRVDGVPLQKSGGDGGYSEVTVPSFQPDPLTTLSPWH